MKSLLMGGQACVLYGAAEFSRDLDLALRDWPMIRRLVEASYFSGRDTPSAAAVDFWLRELRTPEILIEAVPNLPAPAVALLPARPLLSFAAARERSGLRTALAEEEQAEREKDRRYWEPLRRELALLRRRERRHPA